MLALNILLSITILLQVVAVTISLRLMRITKFNAAWILFTIAFTLMLFQLLGDLFFNIWKEHLFADDVMVWIGVVTSICFTGGLFVVNKLISYISIMEQKRRISEKRILNTIIATEEKERRRFSNDLHDGLGPLLSSVKLSVSALNTLECTPSQKEILQNADYVIGEAIKSLKETSNNLSPHMLNNFGVNRAVSSFVNKLILPENMKIDYNSDLKTMRFEPNVEAIIYRVTCELINNAIKHSEAKRIKIRHWLHGDKVEVFVSDNGIGFNYENLENDPARGMGLSNIASRISSLKGTMEVDSYEGIGTTISITIKVK
ncbi:MAG: ATP-binding protein [Rikenellaceae bacterium]